MEYKIDSSSDMQKFKKKLVNINDNVRRRVITKAMRAGAGVVRKDARRRAKQLDDKNSPNNISKNISVRFLSGRAKREGDFMMMIGVRGGGRSGQSANQGNPGGDTFYWRFLELGAEQMHGTTPFLLPALNENVSSIYNTIIKKFETELNNEINKAGK